MSNSTQMRTAKPGHCADTTALFPGLSAGTLVLTLDGALPVENLMPGDRVITRDGARTLRGVHVKLQHDTAMIRVSASTLGAEQPEDDMLIPPDQQILIRDWRAKALKGTHQALVHANRLIDGEYIRAETVSVQRLFRLDFDAAAVIYAGGLELACNPQTVAA
ncbi:MAG: Hint domain-containing protein [Pseudorhodobacter sp.]|nr:Hint domain-containing protein [Pseudorhodobacter sp.]